MTNSAWRNLGQVRGGSNIQDDFRTHVSFPVQWLIGRSLTDWAFRTYIEHLLSTGADLPPGDIWKHLDMFLVVTPGVKVLLACSRWRPEMLLSMPQCPGWPPSQS